MLRAVPKRWFSWGFTVMQGPEALADIAPSWWREKGVLTVQGRSYRVYREGFMSGDFVLESSESVIVRAKKPSAFRRSFLIEHVGKQYTLRARSAFGRAYLLLDGETEVGSLLPEGFFMRQVTVDLPEGLQLPVKVFIVWLAVILWKRDAEAAA